MSPVTQSDPVRVGPGVGMIFAGCTVTAGFVDFQDWSSGDETVGDDFGHVFMTFAAAFLGVGPRRGEQCHESANGAVLNKKWDTPKPLSSQRFFEFWGGIQGRETSMR